MEASRWATWFTELLDGEALTIVGAGLGAEIVRRIQQGTATVSDLIRAAWELGRDPRELFPVSFDDFDRFGDDLLRGDAERVAQRM